MKNLHSNWQSKLDGNKGLIWPNYWAYNLNVLDADSHNLQQTVIDEGYFINYLKK